MFYCEIQPILANCKSSQFLHEAFLCSQISFSLFLSAMLYVFFCSLLDIWVIKWKTLSASMLNSGLLVLPWLNRSDPWCLVRVLSVHLKFNVLSKKLRYASRTERLDRFILLLTPQTFKVGVTQTVFLCFPLPVPVLGLQWVIIFQSRRFVAVSVM